MNTRRARLQRPRDDGHRRRPPHRQRRRPLRRHRRGDPRGGGRQARPRAGSGGLLRDRRHRPRSHRTADGGRRSAGDGPDERQLRPDRELLDRRPSQAAHHRLPRRRPDRPLRQPQLDLHRRLPRAEGTLQRLRRRLRRRLSGERLHRVHAARPAEVRRTARLPRPPPAGSRAATHGAGRDSPAEARWRSSRTSA